MPIRQHYAPGTPCWIDRITANLNRTQAFYAALFGWDYIEEDGYRQARIGGQTVAGIGSAPVPVEFWTVYLASKDLGESLAKVAELGGRVVMPPVTLGANGRLFLATDPAGAPVGFWEGYKDEGIVLVDEIGVSRSYELVVPDRSAAEAFYGAISPAEDPTVIVEEPGVAAPYWRIGFGVADVAEAGYRAVTAGARAAVSHADGTATVTDPAGASFGLRTLG
jgi:predicted enzyme related to lactoylglutathione lyase